MHVVGTPQGTARRVTAIEVADLELRGTWVVDVRRRRRTPERAGWLVPWEDDIAFLTDSPALDAEAASERCWPSFPLDVA